MNLKSLSIKEKVGQKFMCGVNSDNIDIIIDLIKNYYIGGVVLYKKNYKNYEEMLSVIKRLKEANSKNKLPLFISIDQEGGRVNRMPSEFINIKNIYDIFKNNDGLIFDSASLTGKMLYESDINMDFAPVLDIYENSRSKVLYKRCFYGNIDDVSNHGANYIKGLTDNGVISVVKHFPGHGVSKVDSHFITPCIYDYRNILDKHIKPFERAINEGIDAIMVGHLIIRKLTQLKPASISSNFIKKYLRDYCHFDGLIITDDINMLKHNIFYKFNYLKNAFISGSDIILVKIKKDKVKKMINKCIKLASNNSEYEKIIDDSIDRIIKIKNKYNINDSIDYSGCNIDNINEEISKLNKLCS